jgi:hypothetical protein
VKNRFKKSLDDIVEVFAPPFSPARAGLNLKPSFPDTKKADHFQSAFAPPSVPHARD